MSDLHLNDFYHDVAKTLVVLLKMFPRPVTLYAEDICGPDEPDEYGVHSTRYQACFATLLWLAEEGYLRHVDVIRQEAVDQVVLSGRCFAALMSQAPEPSREPNLPPSVQSQRNSYAQRLDRALEQRASVDIEGLVTAFIQRML